MEVSETLREAWTAVQASGIPAELHEAAFREAIRLLAPPAPGPAAPVQQPPRRNSATPGQPSASADDGAVVVSEDELYDRVVSQTGVSREKLEQVVHLDDNGPRVSIPGLKLGKNNAERARAVAQLLVITRGFGLEEKETALEVVRAECDRLKVYDPANFSAHMKALPGYVISGSGQNRRLRAKGQGIAAFAGLVDAVLGGD